MFVRFILTLYSKTVGSVKQNKTKQKSLNISSTALPIQFDKLLSVKCPLVMTDFDQFRKI